MSNPQCNASLLLLFLLFVHESGTVVLVVLFMATSAKTLQGIFYVHTKQANGAQYTNQLLWCAKHNTFFFYLLLLINCTKS